MGFSQTLRAWDKDDSEREVAVPASPGDLLVHHSRMVHRAEPNRSASRHRRAIGAIFYAASAKVDEAAHQQRQAEIRARAAVLPGQESRKRGADDDDRAGDRAGDRAEDR